MTKAEPAAGLDRLSFEGNREESMIYEPSQFQVADGGAGRWYVVGPNPHFTPYAPPGCGRRTIWLRCASEVQGWALVAGWCATKATTPDAIQPPFPCDGGAS